MYWYYFVKLSKSYCRKAFRFARNPEALAMSSSEPMPSPEHGTTTTTALTLAQSALGDRDDGEEATRICQLVRQVGEKKQAKQALIEEATPGRVPVFAVRINYSITCITNCITICETLVLRMIQE